MRVVVTMMNCFSPFRQEEVCPRSRRGTVSWLFLVKSCSRFGSKLKKGRASAVPWFTEASPQVRDFPMVFGISP